MTTTRKPFILVLEGLSGAAECVDEAGGESYSMTPFLGRMQIMHELFAEGCVDGLLLTGGGDVDPRRYGQTAHKETYGVSEDRDTVEFSAVRLARRYGLPIMGICRGAQVLNVAHGGSLWQHLPDRGGKSARKHKSGTMTVVTKTGSLAHEAMGHGAPVLHLHHQAVRKPGKGLRATGWHGDGTIEVIESVTGAPWRVGVQFHPEYAAYGDPERGFFRQLVLAAAKGAGLPIPAECPPKPVVSNVHTWPTVIGGKSESKLSEHGQAVLDAWKAESAAGYCAKCQTEFDWREDYLDHQRIIHDDWSDWADEHEYAPLVRRAPLALPGRVEL